MHTSLHHAALPVRHVRTGEQLALRLAAGTELFCASGAVRLHITPSGGIEMPLSLDLAAGRAWRCPEGASVLLIGCVPSRVLVHEPPPSVRITAAPSLWRPLWARVMRVLSAA